MSTAASPIGRQSIELTADGGSEGGERDARRLECGAHAACMVEGAGRVPVQAQGPRTEVEQRAVIGTHRARACQLERPGPHVGGVDEQRPGLVTADQRAVGR